MSPDTVALAWLQLFAVALYSVVALGWVTRRILRRAADRRETSQVDRRRKSQRLRDETLAVIRETL